MESFLHRLFNSIIRFKITREIKIKLLKYCTEKYWIMIYGDYYVKSKNIVVLIAVNSNTMKNKLESNQLLLKELKKIFEKNNYSKEDIKSIRFYFESQETVDLESKGDWHLHLQ